MQDIASQVAQLESRIDALQSSQQTLTILFVIALIVIAVLIGMLIATRSQRPPARHAPPLPPRPEPRVPQAAPAAAEPPRPAPAASAPAPAPAAADMPGALKPEIAAVITASVAAFLAGRPFVIRSVHLQTDPAHMWGKLGRQQIQLSHTLTRSRQ